MKKKVKRQLENELVDWKSESDMVSNHPIYQADKKPKHLKDLSKIKKKKKSIDPTRTNESRS